MLAVRSRHRNRPAQMRSRRCLLEKVAGAGLAANRSVDGGVGGMPRPNREMKLGAELKVFHERPAGLFAFDQAGLEPAQVGLTDLAVSVSVDEVIVWLGKRGITAHARPS